MTTAIRLYSFSYREVKTYLWASAFIIGNLVLPQLCHSIPAGGVIFLPIFFFTLIGAYKYGLTVGLLTAIASPLINSALFGMPPVAILPEMIVKSVLLAVSAAYIAKRTGKISFVGILGCIVCYQLLGSGFELLTGSSLTAILQSLKMGIPGMLIQLLGGYGLLRLIGRI